MKQFILLLTVLSAATACSKPSDPSPVESLDGRYRAVIDPIISASMTSTWMEIRQNWSDASYKLTYQNFDKGPYSLEGVTVQKDSLTYALYADNQKIGEYTYGEFRTENGTMKTWLLTVRHSPKGQNWVYFRGVKE